MMKAIAIDDEPIALEIVKSHALKVPFVNLKAEFTDAFKAFEYLQREHIDLLFLDIKMPDISGIDFFNSLSNKPLLIFTTAYSEHAVASFEMDAVDYLLKPFSLPRFIKACNKAYELYKTRSIIEPAAHIFIKSGYEQEKIDFSDILYIEAAGNYVTFFLKDRKVLTRNTFMEIINQLPAKNFIRVHRSYVVSVSKINKVERHQLTIGSTPIPVSKAYRQHLAELIKAL